MVVAPLVDSLLASIVATTEPVDVAVAAVTPHWTAFPGPGSVEVMATTLSTAASSFPVSKDLHLVSPAAGSELGEALTLVASNERGEAPSELQALAQ